VGFVEEDLILIVCFVVRPSSSSRLSSWRLSELHSLFLLLHLHHHHYYLLLLLSSPLLSFPSSLIIY
jgi:hypothetical protein